METLADLLDEAAVRFGDRVALTLESDDAPEVWTYARLRRAADAVAEHLRGELGIARGGRVLTWATNSPRLVAAYAGCARAGLTVVPIDPQSTAEFVTRVAERTEATAILLDQDHPVPTGLRAIPLRSLPDGTEAPGAALADRPTADDLAEIVFTSGTTGDPKGVMLTHRNIVSNVQSLEGVLPRGPHYRLLSLLPLSHMLEQTGGLYLPLSYGASISYLQTRQPATIFRALAERRVTMMIVVPLVLEILVRGIEREVRRKRAWGRWQLLHRIAGPLPTRARRLLFTAVRRQVGASLELFFCGGARLDPELAGTWERMGIKVVEGYGATECSPVVAANTVARRVPGEVGIPIQGVAVRIASDGELQVRGPNVTAGYWRNEAATSLAFTPDGWYRTGDLAERGPHGGLVLKGRLRDLIVLPNGMNVYPEDVEDALRGEDAVADCVVLGRPDGRGGVSVHAVVLPHSERRADPGLTAALGEAVQRANRQLAQHQRITSHSCWAGEDFPRTSSMKVKRSEVQATFE